MLHATDNELMCRVGAGTPMGNLLREYWIPSTVPSSLLPSPDCPPVRVTLLGEDLIAFRTTSGDVGHGRQRLPAPRRVAVLRPQRGGRPALRLPRLEVRRRPAPASTCRRSPPRATSRPRCASGVPVRRAQRHGLDLHGIREDAAAAAGVRVQHVGAGEVLPPRLRVLRLQLGAGDGGRRRLVAHRLPALAPHAQAPSEEQVGFGQAMWNKDRTPNTAHPAHALRRRATPPSAAGTTTARSTTASPSSSCPSTR